MSATRRSRRRTLPLTCVSIALAVVGLAAQAREVAKDAATSERAPLETVDFYGQVLAPDGQPVAATVFLVVDRPENPEAPPARDASEGWERHGVERVETDESGAFLHPVAADGRVAVWVETPTHAPHREPPRDPSTPLQVRLEPGRVVHGVVYEQGSGKAIAGATVRLSDKSRAEFADGPFRETETGEDGSFVLAGLPETQGTLSVFAPAKAESRTAPRPRLPAQDGEAEPPAERIFLEPGARFAGTVVDSEGRPVAGVALSVTPTDLSGGIASARRYGWRQAETDAEGNFRFEGLPSGTTWSVGVRHDDYADASIDGIRLEPGANVDDRKIELGRGARVVWRHALPDGEEPGEIGLRVTPEGGGWMSRNRTMMTAKVQQGEDGTYFADKIPPGSVRLSWEPERWVRIERETPVVLTEGEAYDAGTLELKPGLSVSGVVVDGDDEPVEGAIVAIRERNTWVDLKSEETGADGGFEIRGLEDGKYAAEIRDARFATLKVAEVPTDGTPVEWVLSGLGTISGEIALEDGGVPEKVKVRWFRKSEEKGMMAMFAGMNPDRETDVEPEDEGAYEAEGFAPGEGAFEFVVEDYKPHRVEDVELVEGEALELDPIVLERGLEVRGRVVDPEGGPVAGAVASVSKPKMFNIPGMGSAAGAESDPDGRFVVKGLSAGSMVLQVSHREYAPFKQSLSLEESEEAPDEIEVRLTRGGVLTGQVRDSAGAPVPGATVLSMMGMGGDQRVAETGGDGRYRFEKLAAGSYMVMRTGDDPSAGMAGMNMKSAVLKDGETTVVDFDDTAEIELRGTVRRGGEPIPDAQLIFVRGMVASGTPDLKTAQADASGAYEVGLDKAGSYSVQVISGNQMAGDMQQHGIATIQVPDSPNASIDVVLAERGFGGRVLDEDGNPIAGASVTAMRKGADVFDPGGQGGATTREDGTFRVTLQQEGAYDVTVQHAEFPPASRTVEVADGFQAGVEITLSRGGTLRGIVLDPTGNPAAGVLVQASPAGSTSSLFAGASMTDGSGRFELTVREGESLDVIATLQGYAPARLEGVVAGPETPEITLRLEAGRALIVRIVDSDGAPRSGVTVRLLAQDAALAQTRMDWWIPKASDATGTVRFESLAPGAYDVTLVGDDVPAPTSVQVSGESDQQVVVVDPR